MLASDLLSLATALKNGTMSSTDFSKLVRTPAGAGALFFTISPLIDFAAALNTIQTLVPSTPGYYFKAQSVNGVFTQAGGTLSTVPSFSWGNNAARDNVGATVTLGTPFSAGFANPPAFAGGLSTNNNSAQMLDMTTPLDCKVTVAATGTGLVAKGYFLVAGQVWPVTLP